MKPNLNRDVLYKEYVENGKSFYQMEKEYGIPQARLRYQAKTMGIPIRTKEQAQQLAVKEGRCYNPSAGKPVSPEIRAKIARTLQERYKNMSEEEKEAKRERSRQQFKNNPEAAQRFMKSGQEAAKGIAQKGSNVEKYIYKELLDRGYIVSQHRECLIQSEKMHIDLLLEREHIAIEIDGPSHLRAVYSEEDFVAKKEKDQRKNGLLLQDGYGVIRAGVERGRSLITKINLLNEILEAVEELKKNPNRVIYVGKYVQANN